LRHPAFDYENRIVIVRVEQATVASIYVPNGGKDFPAKMRFLEALDTYASEFHDSGQPLVLCGDLNVARTDMDVHPKERRPKAIGQLPEERALIERIIGRGLVDVQRQIEPDNADLFTWWAPWRNLKQRNIGWRIDYVLASQALAVRAQSSIIRREIGTSDHGPVVVTFDFA
jgi:exodeoxyribonuclease III